MEKQHRKAIILKCKPGAQFHFGRYAPDVDTALSDSSVTIHSDTLFAAIVKTYSDLFEDTDEFVGQFESGNIKISSGFFCIQQLNTEGDTHNVWFLPKPVSFNLIDNAPDYKSLKKVSYISKALWESLTKPEDMITRTDVVIIQDKYALLNSEICVKDQAAWKYITLYREQTLPKVHVSKPRMEGGIYQLSTVEISDNSEYADNLSIHYYFIVNESKKFTDFFGKKFNVVINILAHNGIGAERSTIGQLYGIQEYTDWSINEHSSDYCCTLSLLSPAENDLTHLIYYESLFRGGRRAGGVTGYRIQQSVRMLQEGAIVKTGVKGTMHNITPEKFTGIHKRNGISLNVSIPEAWIL